MSQASFGFGYVLLCGVGSAVLWAFVAWYLNQVPLPRPPPEATTIKHTHPAITPRSYAAPPVLPNRAASAADHSTGVQGASGAAVVMATAHAGGIVPAPAGPVAQPTLKWQKHHPTEAPAPATAP